MNAPNAAGVLPPPHIVHVDKKRTFTSATLSPDAVRLLQAAMNAIPWYRDRWAQRSFRTAALVTLRTDAPGGLILLGPGMHFEPPPPFAEFFEPIELGAADEQLKTLSGPAPTRQERTNRRAAWISGGLGIVVFIGLAWAFAAGGGNRIVGMLLLGVLGLAVVLTVVIDRLHEIFGEWFLVPAGVAIVRGRRRDGLVLLTRFDCCAALRYVSTGKTVSLMLELWPSTGKRHSRAVTDREALSFLAAWQSPQKPPTREQLRELMG